MDGERQTYRIEVEGIGAFTCYRREMRESLKILAEYSRIVEGDKSPSPILDSVANVVATLRVLVKEAPEGWALDSMDPFVMADFERLAAVTNAISKEEEFFRQGPRAEGEAAGAGTRREPGTVDSPHVPALPH